MTADPLTRARVLLAQADDTQRIGPMFWWLLRQAATQLTLAGRADLAEPVNRMLDDGSWNGLREVIAMVEGERV